MLALSISVDHKKGECPEGAPGQGEQHCKEGRGQESLWGTGPGQRVGGSWSRADPRVRLQEAGGGQSQ